MIRDFTPAEFYRLVANDAVMPTDIAGMEGTAYVQARAGNNL